MKKEKGIVFIIALVLILALAYTAIPGIYTWYGDVENTAVKGVPSITEGLDISARARAVLIPQDVTEVTDSQLKNACETIVLRLSYSGLTGVEALIDEDNGNIILEFPITQDFRDYEVESAIELATQRGRLEFRRGDDTDDDGNPTGELIMTGDHVSTATSGYNSDNGVYAVYILTDDDGKKLLADATSDMNGEVIAIWLDGVLIASPTVTDPVTEGRAVISNRNFTVNRTQEISRIITSGELPFGLSAESTVVFARNTDMKYPVLAAIIIGAAFLLACIWLIVEYKITGLVISLGVLLEGAVCAMIFTGYFNVFPVQQVSMAAIVGSAVVIFTTLYIGTTQAQRIKEGFAEGAGFETALRGGFKGGSAAVADACVLVFITAFIAAAAFSTSGIAFDLFGGFMAKLGISGLGSLYTMCLVAMYGSLVNILITVLITRHAEYSAGRINFLRKPVFFGGAK